ncbi:DegT/DnrJ/EryC1/StrS family aminotransferase [Candidatus Omnitrophota bacterium]
MIDFAKPFLGEEEAAAARETILSAWVTQGPKVKEFEETFASYVGSKYACAVSSCTSALHLALIAAGVKPGDAVITVSHSFIATANSIRHCNAEPVFVDIDIDTFNMSPASLEKCLRENCGTRNVAAIMPVHQMGMPCDLKPILALACKFNLPVIEDAACAAGSEISIDNKKTLEKIGRPHGDIACFSFHPRKVITTGEGGMITTNNPDYDKKIRLLRHHGMNISDLLRHSAKKVIFEEYITPGYNYRMSDIQAAIGIVQLKRLPEILSKRKELANLYAEGLKDVSWLKLPHEPLYCRTNWQSYPARLLDNSPMKRDKLMQYLLDAGISTRRGIMNIHQEPAYASNITLHNSELARDTVILLPLFYEIKYEQVEKIIDVIKNVEQNPAEG